MIRKLLLVSLAGGTAFLFGTFAPSGKLHVADAHPGHCGDTLPGGETWPAGVHTITCDVVVAGGALTVEPGAIVKFQVGTHIILGVGAEVNSLNASGSVFTSIRDDSVGGDTNGDGICGIDATAACPAEGDWGAIFIATCCLNPAIINIASSEIHYGGGSNLLPVDRLAPIAAPCGGQISLTNSLVTKNAGNGVYMGCGTIPALSGDTIDSDGGGSNAHGLVLTDASVGTLSANSFDNNPGCAILINNPQGTISPEHNTLSNNNRNGVCLSGNFGTSTFNGANSAVMPYVVTNANVTGGAAVQFNPGTCIKMDVATSLVVGVGAEASSLSLSGAKVTSVMDDAFCGGDTNNDGTITLPAPGGWGAITLTGCCGGGASVTASSSMIRFGGGGTSEAIVQNPCNGNGSISVANSDIRQSAKAGVYNACGQVIVEDSTITSNGTDGITINENSSAFRMRRNSIFDNGGLGIDWGPGGPTCTGGGVNCPVVATFTFGGASGTACSFCTVDLFSDAAEEGRLYHGSAPTNATGNWSFSGALAGPGLTATATDTNGNTSEFSFPVCPADRDCDGVSDAAEPPCGAQPLNAASRPERTDGVFAGVDDDGDTQIDEALPAGSEAYDCDGDGFVGTSESHVGTSDQDPCGGTGWPADLDSLGGSANVLNIGDFNSFIFPLRGDGSFNKFGHPVPDAADPNIARWNLDPNGTINIGDINALNPAVLASTARPPMFGGRPAFFTNGGQCPWPA